jgi:aspartate racemase
MKKIGLIGGVTWASTIDYYRIINELSNEKSSGHHTAEVIIYSVDFHEVLIRMQQAKWDEIEQLFIEKANSLKQAGADFFAIGSNTLAKVGHRVSKAVDLPIVGMVESVAGAIRHKGFKKVGFMGTTFAMNDPFYREGLKQFGIEAIIPGEEDKAYINHVIMDELAYDVLNPESRKKFLDIMNRMHKEEKVEGIVLGCTEIPMLIKQQNTYIPVFDTTEIHAAALVDFALS